MAIVINERASIKKSLAKTQQCVYCGEKMTVNTVAISMNNCTDDLSIYKNLWIHIDCLPKLNNLVKRTLKKKKHYYERMVKKATLEAL